MSTIAAIATVIAAIAALVTIYFARQTVQESIQARTENHEAHAQELKAMLAATNEAASQHQLEMADRQRAFDADLVVRRLEQLEQVSELLLRLVEVSRDEYRDPAAPFEAQGGRITMRTTQIPSIQSRLRTAVAILKTLGGPDLEGHLPVAGRGNKASSYRVWTGSISALVVIEDIVESDPTLRLPGD